MECEGASTSVPVFSVAYQKLLGSKTQCETCGARAGARASAPVRVCFEFKCSSEMQSRYRSMPMNFCSFTSNHHVWDTSAGAPQVSVHRYSLGMHFDITLCIRTYNINGKLLHATYHVYFGYHVYAGYVYIHPYRHRSAWWREGKIVIKKKGTDWLIELHACIHFIQGQTVAYYTKSFYCDITYETPTPHIHVAMRMKLLICNNHWRWTHKCNCMTDKWTVRRVHLSITAWASSLMDSRVCACIKGYIFFVKLGISFVVRMQQKLHCKLNWSPSSRPSLGKR